MARRDELRPDRNAARQTFRRFASVLAGALVERRVQARREGVDGGDRD